MTSYHKIILEVDSKNYFCPLTANGSNHDSGRCQGSACMLWRWSVDDYQANDFPIFSSAEGYCGAYK